MRKAIQLTEDSATAEATLTLTYDERQRCRLRTRLDSGEEFGLMLPRGTALKEGDQLLDDGGRVVLVKAAKEEVSAVECSDPHLLARLCYHLGNRHASLCIEPTVLSYLKDHVLDEMVIGLGAEVVHKFISFEPESGAYGNGHNHGGHNNG